MRKNENIMIRFGESTKYAITDNFSYKVRKTIWDNVLIDNLKNTKYNLREIEDITVWDIVWDIVWEGINSELNDQIR